MQVIVALCVCLVVASAAPAPAETAARRALPAIHQEEIHDDFGQYALRYVTAEGITYEERGRLVPDPDSDGKDYVLVYEGEYSFIGDDGITYKTKYTTDVNGGHQVQGDHLPKAPEALEVKEDEPDILEVSSTSTTELPTSTEAAEPKTEAKDARKLTEFPLEQHDEQDPKH